LSGNPHLGRIEGTSRRFPSGNRFLPPTMVNMNQLNIRRALVSGGAGFIGSHIADTLVSSGVQVTIYDNFSTGQESFISHHADNPRVRVVRADVLDSERLNQEMADCDFVFHMQANA